MLNSSRIDKTKLVAFSSPGGHKQRATRIDEFCWSMERCCCTWKWSRRDTFRRVPAKNLEGARTTFSLSFSRQNAENVRGEKKALNITQHRIKSYFEVPASWRNSDKFCLICDDFTGAKMKRNFGQHHFMTSRCLIGFKIRKVGAPSTKLDKTK